MTKEQSAEGRGGLPTVRSTDAGTEKLQDVLDFINEWKEWGDVKEAREKFGISSTVASRMLRGKARPKADFLKYLKDKAQKNYSKLRL